MVPLDEERLNTLFQTLAAWEKGLASDEIRPFLPEEPEP